MTLWPSPRSAQTSVCFRVQSHLSLAFSVRKHRGPSRDTHGTHGTHGHISVQKDKLSFTEPCARKRSRHHAHD